MKEGEEKNSTMFVLSAFKKNSTLANDVIIFKRIFFPLSNLWKKNQMRLNV